MEINNITIKEFINKDYRDYAIHTLLSRGIPNFYDCLTPIQRIILLNTPQKTTKSLTVVGNCIADGYHSGNASLEKCLAKLARTSDASEPLVIGDGFFGNQITQDAASARYTSVCSNKFVSDVINKYKHLNNRNNDDTFTFLNIDFPLGLMCTNIGIAVGYKCLILPRKYKDVVDFIAGKNKDVIPYFKDFDGKISQFNDDKSSWLIEGNVIYNDYKKTLHITSLPPLMKYKSFITKIDNVLSDVDYKFINNSKKNIDIIIEVKDDKWSFVRNKIEKYTKMIVKETITFVKDKNVLEYSSVEDYLTDFKNKNILLEYNNMEHEHKRLSRESEFIKAKIDYLKWYKDNAINIESKDITAFLKKYSKEIKERLDNLKLKELTKNDINTNELLLEKTLVDISEIKHNINKKKQYIDNFNFTLNIKRNNSFLSFDDELKTNGIEIFNIEDEVELEDENNIEL